MEPAQTSPFLSGTTWYGALHGIGTFHSWIVSVFGSSMPMPLAPYSANQSRFCESNLPRRGGDPGVTVEYTLNSLVFASILPILLEPNSSKYRLLSLSDGMRARLIVRFVPVFL